MTADLAVSALRAALARRQPNGVVIVHADRGSQFRARSIRAVVVAAGLQGSMGRVAAAGDNAAMESFWSLLQENVLDRQQWRTRADLHDASVYWIEHTDNRRRHQRGLGKLTTVEFELAFAPQAARTAAWSTITVVNQTDSRPESRPMSEYLRDGADRARHAGHQAEKGGCHPANRPLTGTVDDFPYTVM